MKLALSIREMIFAISTNFHRKQHDLHMQRILIQYFEQRPLEFAEVLRMHLMEEMKPKNYNRKYPAFEIKYAENETNAVGDNPLFDPGDDDDALWH